MFKNILVANGNGYILLLKMSLDKLIFCARYNLQFRRCYAKAIKHSYSPCCKKHIA